MAKMVSRWENKAKLQKAEIQGHMFSNGEIHYTMIRGNTNLGQVTAEEKEQIIKNFKMVEVFNEEQQCKEELELLGFFL